LVGLLCDALAELRQLPEEDRLEVLEEFERLIGTEMDSLEDYVEKRDELARKQAELSRDEEQ
jgi:hypothetical protein